MDYDIVSQLRNPYRYDEINFDSLHDGAANEIERLREESNRWQATAAGLSEDIGNAEDEIERLSESLSNALRSVTTIPL